jgi:hypothetical protein
MNPTVAEVLMGATVALMTPLPPEAGGDYAASRAGMLATLNHLASLDAESGTSVRVWENGAIRAVLASAGSYDGALGGRLATAAAAKDDNLAVSALDAANADLRRLLIALHEAVEAKQDAAMDRRILELYRDMAHARRLEMPAGL